MGIIHNDVNPNNMVTNKPLRDFKKMDTEA